MAQLINSSLMSTKVSGVGINIHLHAEVHYASDKVSSAVWHTSNELIMVWFIKQFLVYMWRQRVDFGMKWGICQILKFYLATSCTTKSTLVQSFSFQCRDKPEHRIIAFATSLPRSLLKSDIMWHFNSSWVLMAKTSDNGLCTREWNCYIIAQQLYLWDVHKAKPAYQTGQRDSKDATVSLSQQHVSQPAVTSLTAKL